MERKNSVETSFSFICSIKKNVIDGSGVYVIYLCEKLRQNELFATFSFTDAAL